MGEARGPRRTNRQLWHGSSLRAPVAPGCLRLFAHLPAAPNGRLKPPPSLFCPTSPCSADGLLQQKDCRAPSAPLLLDRPELPPPRRGPWTPGPDDASACRLPLGCGGRRPGRGLCRLCRQIRAIVDVGAGDEFVCHGRAADAGGCLSASDGEATGQRGPRWPYGPRSAAGWLHVGAGHLRLHSDGRK